MTHKTKLYIALFLFLFSGIYFIVRMPLINEPLYFEEGIFAELIVHHPAGPLYKLSSRIDGVNIYGSISHPAASYELLRLGGWLGQRFLKDPVYLNDAAVTPRLRILCSVYQFSIWAIIAIILCFSKTTQSKWGYVILFMTAMSPLALKTSILLQTDNTAGAVFCGTAAILILLAASPDLSCRWRLGLLFAAGLVAGLGKQEWSMALLFALLILLLLQLVMKSRIQIQGAGLILTGLLAGNVISFLYDPTNYAAAFKFMALFSGLSDHSPQHWQLERWWSLIKIEAPFIYICFVLQAIFILSVIVNHKQSMLKYLLFLFGNILLGGYLIINWNYECRYFVPSFAVLTGVCIAVLPSAPPSWYNKTVGAMVATVFISTATFLLFNTPNRNMQLEHIQSGLLKTSQNTILFLDSGAGWNKPQIDYINNNLTYTSGKEIAEKYGKILLLP
jgi:hypothetical protein